MLKHTKGNLLDLAEQGHFDIVVQGCNCFNTMGGDDAEKARWVPIAEVRSEECFEDHYEILQHFLGT